MMKKDNGALSREDADASSKAAVCYHVPVLRERSVQMLVTDPDGIYIDVTFGGGGHSRAILEHLSDKGRLFGVDRDPDAAANAPDDSRFTFIASDFRYLTHWTDYYGITQVNGILADLGVSSHHFDTPERGFSFRYGAALPDMRMNTRGGRTAADLLNAAPEQEIADILFRYGELKDARRIATSLVQARQKAPITTIDELVSVLQPYLPRASEQRRSKLSRIFQAFRIAINDELGALKALLAASEELLVPGGRIAVLTYHSLEDRIVKQWFRQGAGTSAENELIYGAAPKLFQAVNNRPIVADDEEIAHNNRARSAKLRVAEHR